MYPSESGIMSDFSLVQERKACSSINDYNLMDAMQKSILIEQNYAIIRTLNEMLKDDGITDQ